MAIRALLVDDSELVVHRLRKLLESSEDFEVVGSAGHGLAAVEAAEAFRPDLITMDVAMPVMDGVLALKHIMTRRPTRTVMISGFAAPESHMAFDCMRFGALDFLDKPTRRDQREAQPWSDKALSRLRTAALAPFGAFRLNRLRSFDSSRSLPIETPKAILVVFGGWSGLTPFLRLVNAIDANKSVAVLGVFDTSEEVLEAWASYQNRFTALDVKYPTAGPIHAGRCYLARPGQIVGVDSEGRELRWIRGDNGQAQDPVRQLTGSLAARRNTRCAGILVSGACLNALAAVRHLVDEGGQGFVQPRNTAIEGEVLSKVDGHQLEELTGAGHLPASFWQQLGS